MTLYRPLAQTGPAPKGAKRLAGGWCWFTQAEVLTPGRASRIIPASDIPADRLDRLTAPRTPQASLSWAMPHIMGILNVTPDSFSDGGQFIGADAAIAHARDMAACGADMIDVGGESTRPGATLVPVEDEVARIRPVIEATAQAVDTPISVDTRKAAVAEAAMAAGAAMVNDVSAFSFDPQMAETVAKSGAPVCLMHAKGEPETMQDDPRYTDVLHEVYSALETHIATAEAAGIARARILVDPGIGFGKTLDHNLTLLRHIGVFHGLGCPILLGASRKRFIDTVTDAPSAADRLPGTLAITLIAAMQGVQLHRVHDITPAVKALKMAQAVLGAKK
ncbi:dihydropteroate synthase [Cognatishimia sp. MH4019]|uniref:dihydropteroate synthase n=1 Tax=Cognatishimia sp. MH4019 TaxID=2854030 RepID=UPI001CD38D18|nr:dihydropteroate synthase [Cognatishimia sp. MH4019]